MTSSYFPGRLEGYFEDDDRHFTLTADFVYDDAEKDIRVVVPKGFTTDFNSTPQPIWWYFAPWQYPEAGVVHDWLYGSPKGFSHPSGKAVEALDRGQCDDIHRRILHLKGMRWAKRQAVHTGLSAFSWKAWGEHRAKDAPTTSSAPSAK